MKNIDMRFRSTGLLLLVFSLALSTCSAVGECNDYAEIIQLAKSSQGQKVSVDQKRFEHLRRELIETVQTLEWTLHNEPLLKEEWDSSSLLNQIKKTLVTEPGDFVGLNQIAKELYGFRRCLNHPKYLMLRDHLRKYVYFVRTMETDPVEFQNHYEAHLSQLISELESRPENPDFAKLARSINWLVHSGQAPRLVEALKKSFAHPAIMIDLNPVQGEQGIAQFSQPVNETQYTSNLIAGAQVEGNSKLTGDFRAKLLENSEHATVRVFLKDGLIETLDSRGTTDVPALKGTVWVNGSARTYVERAYVDLHFDGEKIVCGEPVVDCRTESTIKDISFSRGYVFPKLKVIRNQLGMGPDLIEKMVLVKAQKESVKKKPQAEQESAQIAARNLAQSIKKELEKKLAEYSTLIEDEIEDVIKPNFLRHGIYFDKIVSQSSSSRVRVAFDKKGISNLGAPKPIVTHKQNMSGSLELMIHESSFLNFFTELASGARWHDSTWAYVQKTVTGFNSFSFMVGARERWSCVMDWDAPVSFRFKDNQVAYSFRIQSFRISGKDYDFPFKVTAHYQPKIQHYGVDLTRVGEVKVEWLDQIPNDPFLESFVLETFNDFMQEKQHWDSLIIPYGGPWGDMDKMRFKSFSLENGWFVAEASPSEYEQDSLIVQD